jgi:hypothetical protein
MWRNIESKVTLVGDDCMTYKKILNIKDVENYRQIWIDYGIGR